MRATTTTTHRRRRRAERPAGLGAIAELVDAAFHADQRGNGVIVRVIDAPDGNTDEVEIGLKPLDGEHPFSALGGFTAPPEWSAIGVVVSGRARHLDAPERPPTPIVTTCLCDRTGAMASLLRSDGGPPVEIPGPAVGLIVDTLRRTIGVATAPPDGTSRSLLTIAWLDRILEAASVSGAPLTSWASVASLHPAAAGRSLAWRALADAARLHAEAWPWSRLRLDPSGISLPGDPLPPDVAAWVDDGMWARWALGAFPEPGDMARALVALLSPALADRVVSTLAATLDDE
jgi:hypothetical protein